MRLRCPAGPACHASAPQEVRCRAHATALGGGRDLWGYIQHSPGTPTTGLRERGNDTSKTPAPPPPPPRPHPAPPPIPCPPKCQVGRKSQAAPGVDMTATTLPRVGVGGRGGADAHTAHHATFSTAPAHQLLGSANAETTPAGAPAAAADRTQRPDATCEGKTG